MWTTLWWEGWQIEIALTISAEGYLVVLFKVTYTVLGKDAFWGLQWLISRTPCKQNYLPSLKVRSQLVRNWGGSKGYYLGRIWTVDAKEEEAARENVKLHVANATFKKGDFCVLEKELVPPFLKEPCSSYYHYVTVCPLPHQEWDEK